MTSNDAAAAGVIVMFWAVIAVGGFVVAKRWGKQISRWLE